MSPTVLSLTALGSLLLLLAIRVPIAVAMLTVSFCGIGVIMGFNVAWNALAVIPYQFSSSWILSSVPMFVLMGYVAYRAELTQGLFRAVQVWLARVPGGLAIAAIFGASGFASVTGSSVACAAAMGRIAVPEMTRAGYAPGLSTGVVAAAGTIGALIPPSVLMIMYGVIAQVPVAPMFLGGIMIGLLTATGYIAVVLLRVWLDPTIAPRTDVRYTLVEKLAALKEIWPTMVIIIVVFGGLFGGLFTPTEAGAVGALMSCLVGIVTRRLDWPRFRLALFETLLTSGALFIIAVAASLFARFLAMSGVGDVITAGVAGLNADPLALILVICLIYLVLGLFLEPLGAMLLTLPILLPVVELTPISLIWLGVLITKLLEIGMLTPPVGMNVFVIKSVVGNLISTIGIFRGVTWFIIIDLVIVALMIAFPGLVLYLPGIAG
jgi:tripartite ATP-independent transporter DctM subunit